MTQEDLNKAIQEGQVIQDEENVDSSTKPPTTPTAPAQQPTSIDQFVPLMVQLSSIQQYSTTAPTKAPQSLAEQIQFVLISGSYFIYFWANNQWNKVAAVGNSAGIYGDGSDGALVFDGTTTVLGMVPSGGVYTMTRDIFATTIVINAGATLKPNGYFVYAKTSITGSGTISVAGGNGGNGGNGVDANGSGVSGAGGTGGSAGVGIPSGTIKQPGNAAGGGGGGNGGSAGGSSGGTGSNETNCALPNNASNPGSGGSGNVNSGSGFGANGGAAGPSGTITQTTKAVALYIALALRNAIGNIGCNPTPGGAGGGGGGKGISSGDAQAGGGGGGGSGAPGGIMVLVSPVITVNVTGALNANGGNGGTGGNAGTASNAFGVNAGNYGGGGGGGGAGGNGGLIILITPSYTNNGSVTVTGGTGANGGNFGGGANGNIPAANGTGGSNGTAGQVIQIVP